MERSNAVYGWSLEDNLEVIKANELYLAKMRNNELTNEELGDLLLDNDIIDTYEEDVFYIEVDDYHDLFRTGYTETILHSLQEALAFISTEANNVILVYPIELTTDRLNQFFTQYPQGIITFG